MRKEKIKALTLRRTHKQIGDDCAFCLAVFELRQNVHELPCGHCFHAGCWRKHVSHSRKIDGAAPVKCPLCRVDVGHLLP